VAISTVSSKGQVTLPARMRRQLKLKPQDAVTIETIGDAIVIRRATEFLELKGFLGDALPAEVEKQGMLSAVLRHSREA